jgi:antitoxin component YwqK of YwqJK toxin-antitoxin module
MKKLLLIVLPLLLIVGCSKSIEYSTLITKDGVMFSPDSDKPYNGRVFINYSTGEKSYSGTYKNGLLINHSYFDKDGDVKKPINYETSLVKNYDEFRDSDVFWNYNRYPLPNKAYSGPVFSLNYKGLKKIESILQNGIMISFTQFQWYDNGQKKYERNFKHEREEGLSTEWYDNGQKKYEVIFKKGYEDGLCTEWYENGQKYKEIFYNDGKEVSEKEWNEDGSVKK